MPIEKNWSTCRPIRIMFTVPTKISPRWTKEDNSEGKPLLRIHQILQMARLIVNQQIQVLLEENLPRIILLSNLPSWIQLDIMCNNPSINNHPQIRILLIPHYFQVRRFPC